MLHAFFYVFPKWLYEFFVNARQCWTWLYAFYHTRRNDATSIMSCNLYVAQMYDRFLNFPCFPSSLFLQCSNNELWHTISAVHMFFQKRNHSCNWMMNYIDLVSAPEDHLAEMFYSM